MQRLIWGLIFLGGMGATSPWLVFAAGERIPLTHPLQKGEDLRTCTICHDSDNSFPFARYNHTQLFGEKHAAAARTHPAVCRMCHGERHCSVCHGVGMSLKPEIRMQGDPRPRTPHRGDYLTRHRIDGRLNPAACFRCHGRPRSARSCRPCHQ